MAGRKKPNANRRKLPACTCSAAPRQKKPKANAAPSKGVFQFVAAAAGLLASGAAIIATMGLGGGLLRTHLLRRQEAAEQLRSLLKSWDVNARAAALPLLA